MDIILPDIISIIAQYLPDARAIYATSTQLYKLMPECERKFWRASIQNDFQGYIAAWPTKIPSVYGAHVFANAGNLSMVQYLFAVDADSYYEEYILLSVCGNVQDDDLGPISDIKKHLSLYDYETSRRRAAVVKWLCSECNYSIETLHGALCDICAYEDNIDIVKHLYYLGASSGGDNAPVFYAVCFGHTKVADYLRSVSDDDIFDDDTLLDHLTHYGNSAGMKYLRLHDTKNKFDYDDGFISAAVSDNVDIIMYYINHPELMEGGIQRIHNWALQCSCTHPKYGATKCCVCIESNNLHKSKNESVAHKDCQR